MIPTKPLTSEVFRMRDGRLDVAALDPFSTT
jgi:hypothetical protein